MREKYDRLSALDQSFLSFETANAYMHVAITAIFESRSLATADGGIDISRIRRHIAARLRLIPRYRQRLMYTPLVNDALWVDDGRFDLGFHVRHASLPRPGGERQLQRRCAEILERPLDRRRPLWEVWIIEGLTGGRFAMLAKVHHCMVDGIAGVDILAALLGTEPSEAPEPVEPWTPRPQPSERALLADVVRRRGRASIGLLRGLRDAVRSPSQTGQVVGARAAALVRLLRHLGQAPSTPFNQPIGPHRRIDWLSFELAVIKAIRNQLGGTINDVVLTTVAGAVGKFLARRRVRLDGAFRTVVPVSVRAPDERGVPGNRVSVWLTALPVHERDARRRLDAVRAMTAELKDSQEAMGAEVVTQAAEWTTANVIKLAAQFINSARRFNLIVTNVPGPPVPFYLLGAPMVAAYPHLPLFENQGLGVALFSYAGTLYWGVGADWNQMPDLGEFMRDIAESFDELCIAAHVPAPVIVPQPSTATPPVAGRPRLTVHRGSALTLSAAAVAARGRAARARAASAADDLRHATPGPKLDSAHSSRSTSQPVGRR
jgi:diacylglycerol O-acyltransferase